MKNAVAVQAKQQLKQKRNTSAIAVLAAGSGTLELSLVSGTVAPVVWGMFVVLVVLVAPVVAPVVPLALVPLVLVPVVPVFVPLVLEMLVDVVA